MSAALLPFSKSSIYCHSVASEQSITGALGLSEQMVLTQAWLSFLPESDYYSGSYRTTSRLSTRLHTNFSSGLKPQNQVIMHTLCLWNPMQTTQPESTYSFEEVTNLDEHIIQNLGDKKIMVDCLTGPPALDVVNHTIRYLICRESKKGRAVALAALHSYEDLSSATNFMNQSFLIPLQLDATALDLNLELINYLKRNFGDDSICRASIVLGTGPINMPLPAFEYDKGYDYRSVFWTFTPREDLNCLNLSLARASYNLCRKYGAEGVEAYAKTTLFS
jgi:hypothetical protein